MIDPRFHPSASAMRFGDLAQQAGYPDLASGAAADVIVSGAGDLSEATGEGLSFIAQAKYRASLAGTAAGVVLADPKLDLTTPHGVTLVRVEDPYTVFIAMLGVLYPNATQAAALASARPAAAGEFWLEDEVVIGPGAVIAAGVEIGRGTVIGANAVIGAGVAIGRNCIIGAGSVIECAYLGNDVVLAAGVVIGAEGFGFRLGAREHLKIPQLGRVIVQDRVEIGAHTTIDRGTLGDTVIGEGSKIDNLVQIGHNCRLGRNCVISGTCGLGGSTILEDGVIMGGGAASAGHLTLGAGSVVYAGSGVSNSFPAGSTIAGVPAQDARLWKRGVAILRRLAKGE